MRKDRCSDLQLKHNIENDILSYAQINSTKSLTSALICWQNYDVSIK